MDTHRHRHIHTERERKRETSDEENATWTCMTDMYHLNREILIVFLLGWIQGYSNLPLGYDKIRI